VKRVGARDGRADRPSCQGPGWVSLPSVLPARFDCVGGRLLNHDLRETKPLPRLVLAPSGTRNTRRVRKQAVSRGATLLGLEDKQCLIDGFGAEYACLFVRKAMESAGYSDPAPLPGQSPISVRWAIPAVSSKTMQAGTGMPLGATTMPANLSSTYVRKVALESKIGSVWGAS